MTEPAAIVVFDVNIYLDAAELVGAPFTWAKFEAVARQVMFHPIPATHDERVDSLRAIAYSRSGIVIPDEPLEVWTSKHIDDLVVHKASQSGLTAETRGLGWSQADALELLERIVRDLVEQTYGYTVSGVEAHDWAPPLSHEDGRVYETAYRAGDDELSPRYCVTRDGGFRQADLPPRVTVLHPDEWVAHLRKARRPPPGVGPAGLIQH